MRETRRNKHSSWKNLPCAPRPWPASRLQLYMSPEKYVFFLSKRPQKAVKNFSHSRVFLNMLHTGPRQILDC